MGLFGSLLEEGLYQVNKGLNSINQELISNDESHDYKDEFIDPDIIVSSSNTGFCVDGEHYLPDKTANMVVTGSSGVGKSTIISSMSLWKASHNYVIHDAAGELYALCGKHLIEQGYTVRVVNFSHPEFSCGFNPLIRAESVSDIHKVAHQIVKNTLGDDKEKFWSIQSENLIVLTARALLFQESKYRNLTNVRHCIELLNANPTIIDRIIAETRVPEIYNRYKSFLASDVRLRSNITASALACLQLWSDPNIQRICSYDTLDLSDLRKNKIAIFIQCDVLHSSYYSVLSAILVRQIMSSLMAKMPEPDDTRRVLFLLDEFPTLFIPDFSTIISTIRKYHGHLCIMIQCYSQLEDAYGVKVARNIITNCAARLYFSSLDHQTALSLSQELGRYSYEQDGRNSNRELLTASEARQLSADRAILLMSNMNPMILKLRPYYQQPLIMRHIGDILPQPLGDIPDEDVPLIGM